MTKSSFEIVSTVESTVSVTKEFPTFLILGDFTDDGSSWNFFVRIDLCGTGQARVDFLSIDSDGEWTFTTEIRPLRRLGEFFRDGNNYDQCDPSLFFTKIAELRSVLDSIPRSTLSGGDHLGG